MTEKKQNMTVQATEFPPTIRSVKVQTPDGAQQVFVNAALSLEELAEELREALAGRERGTIQEADGAGLYNAIVNLCQSWAENERLLIDPAEAVQLARKVSFLTQANTAVAIVAELGSFRREKGSPGSGSWDLRLLLQTVFNAGRVVGIREERKRRRHSGAKAAPRCPYSEVTKADIVKAIADQTGERAGQDQAY